jgi:hypothetical protein
MPRPAVCLPKSVAFFLRENGAEVREPVCDRCLSTAKADAGRAVKAKRGTA